MRLSRLRSQVLVVQCSCRSLRPARGVSCSGWFGAARAGHHVNDDEHPAGIVRYWQERAASGSHFFISHFRSGDNRRPPTPNVFCRRPSVVVDGSRTKRSSVFWMNSNCPPEIVPASHWRPEVTKNQFDKNGERELTVWEHLISAGIARKT
ncbi:SAM-dependent methyltransferase [Streptomyces sp. NPDC057620]|uniref:SAM-dependent methyltransferase n=1 Tax=Streptomyces sp. NPDC057620 TaxID=3346185 RepID=UPI0036A5ACF0